MKPFSVSAAALAFASVLACGIIGCGGDEVGGSSPESLPKSHANVVEPIVGCTYDYEPVKGPRELARISDLMVWGRIVNPRAGLLHFDRNGNQVRVETDILPVKATSVVAFEPGGEGGALLQYGEIPVFKVEIGCAFPAPQRRAQLESLAGREVLVYLVRRGAGMAPGRVGYGPEGQPKDLYLPVSPEGFLLEMASGGGVRSLELNQRYPRAELSRFLPEERRFPPKGP